MMALKLHKQYFIRQLCLATGLFLSPIMALAAGDYRVEVILFEHLYPETGGEQWTSFPGLPDTGGAVVIGNNSSGTAAYQPLDESLLTLSGAYGVMKNSGQYRPLRYLAWQQPQQSGTKAQTVLLSANREQAVQNLLGYIRVRSGTYLHLDLDLAYYLDGSADEFIRSQSRVTRMKQTRRIKLNEIHYFDHPLFGAIVRVVRL